MGSGVETNLESNRESLQESATAEKSAAKDTVCGFEKKYLIPKGFYFFFFSAQGSLLPYLSLFLKQLELPASQVGIITGIKPYIAFFFIPIWSAIADKYHKSKVLFFFSMLAINMGLLSYAFIPLDLCAEQVPSGNNNVTRLQRRSLRNSSHKMYYMEELSKMAEESSDSPPWPQRDQTTSLQDVGGSDKTNARVFLYLLFVTIIFTTMSCPSLSFGDSATVQLLRENDETHKYGKQRLWGSIGWGVMAFMVGAAVSRTHLCPPGSAKRKDVNYFPCFYTYGTFMLVALFIGLKLNFEKTEQDSTQQNEEAVNNDSSADGKPTESPRAGLVAGMKSFMTPRHLIFLATVFYVGIAMGFIKVFLFWHLKDLGGTQMLFSIMSGVNCIAEVTIYFLSSRLISALGTIRVLWLGLLCYSVRLFFYAFVVNPWYVIPVESLSGITTAAVWASLMSFAGDNTVQGATFTLQGILHSVHWGLGHGCGEFIGGFFISSIGASRTFALFGALSLVDLGAYVLVDRFASKTQSPRESGYEKLSPQNQDTDLGEE